MTKAVRVHKVGGPEALVYEAVDVPAPGPGEVRIRQHAVGLNFIDVYFRTGLYKAPGLPFIPGNEAAGEVLAVGPGVTNFHPGDRVAYYFNLGAYASERNIPWEKLVKLPDHITYEQGAVLMLKGLTVWYLLHKTFKVEPHHRVLIHAAAGGIGLLACQWARAMGAHVIGTVGSKAKADLALANGCDHVILYNEEDFVARVKQISRNELCDVVYDGVGKTTFPGSLSCLKPRGLFVSFGNAVPDEIKQERWNALMARQQTISTRRLKRKVGTRQQVIIDEVGPTVSKGRSKADAPDIDGAVYLSSRRPLRVGEIVTAKIERADQYDLHGSVAGF